MSKFIIFLLLPFYSASQIDSIQNLAVLARAYGYVKYFYPDKSVGKYDWEAFLQSNRKKVIKASNAELPAILNNMFEPICPLISFKEDSNIKIVPRKTDKYAEKVYHIGFGDSKLKMGNNVLETMVNQLLPYKTTYTKFMVSQNDLTLSASFNNYLLRENLYIQFPKYLYSSELVADKTFPKYPAYKSDPYVDAAVLWNIYRHFYPYFDEIERAKFNENLEDYVNRSLVVTKLSEHYKLLKYISAFLRDGHNRVFPPVDLKQYYNPSCLIKLVDGRLYLTKVGEALIQKIKVGDEIVSINNLNISKAIDSLLSIVSIPSESALKSRINQLLSGDKDSEIIFRVKRNKDTFTVKTTRSQVSEFASQGYSDPIQFLEGNIAYINVDNCTLKDIKEKSKQINAASFLIVDLRKYPKNLPTSFLYNFFKAKTLDTVCFYYPVFDKPNGYFRVEACNEVVEINPPKKPEITNLNVFFLSDGQSISKAETWLDIIKHYHLGCIVGQPSAGTNGDMAGYTMKSGFDIQFTSAIAKKHDGSYFMNNPMKPDILIQESLNDVLSGGDFILNNTIRILKNESIPNKCNKK